ncbi:MAG: hypothetical protein DI537_03765 [Stutzerimonas stutzeri]|nr:MAG: hypothetical protein DI537_03765 [Stutzerimonas stutzeri]
MVETRRQPDHLAAIAGQILIGAFEAKQVFDPRQLTAAAVPATCDMQDVQRIARRSEAPREHQEVPVLGEGSSTSKPSTPFSKSAGRPFCRPICGSLVRDRSCSVNRIIANSRIAERAPISYPACTVCARSSAG